MEMVKMTNRNLRKILVGIGLIGALNNPVLAEQPKTQPIKPTLIESVVMADENCPLYRTEALMTNLPYNSEGALVWEHKGYSNLYKLRAQADPLHYRMLSGGPVIQHVESTNNKRSANHEEAGFLGRIKGKMPSDISGKLDLRYFPATRVTDGYLTLNHQKGFADVLGTYDTKTNVSTLRPGIEAKINQHLAAGFEAKLSGKLNNLNTDYLGLRAKYTF
jgi:hypothetical protein